MGTIAYAAVIASAIVLGSVAAEITAEASTSFINDLFDNYMWHPPAQSGTEIRPIDLLSQLAIED